LSWFYLNSTPWAKKLFNLLFSSTYSFSHCLLRTSLIGKMPLAKKAHEKSLTSKSKV
jgi:hypothetical protein